MTKRNLETGKTVRLATVAILGILALAPATRPAHAALTAPSRTESLNCGNGAIDGAEQCDDGNHADGDGCSRLCLVEERCDDGIDNNDDGLVDCEDLNCDGEPACS